MDPVFRAKCGEIATHKQYMQQLLTRWLDSESNKCMHDALLKALNPSGSSSNSKVMDQRRNLTRAVVTYDSTASNGITVSSNSEKLCFGIRREGQVVPMDPQVRRKEHRYKNPQMILQTDDKGNQKTIKEKNPKCVSTLKSASKTKAQELVKATQSPTTVIEDSLASVCSKIDYTRKKIHDVPYGVAHDRHTCNCPCKGREHGRYVADDLYSLWNDPSPTGSYFTSISMSSKKPNYCALAICKKMMDLGFHVVKWEVDCCYPEVLMAGKVDILVYQIVFTPSTLRDSVTKYKARKEIDISSYSFQLQIVELKCGYDSNVVNLSEAPPSWFTNALNQVTSYKLALNRMGIYIGKAHVLICHTTKGCICYTVDCTIMDDFIKKALANKDGNLETEEEFALCYQNYERSLLRYYCCTMMHMTSVDDETIAKIKAAVIISGKNCQHIIPQMTVSM